MSKKCFELCKQHDVSCPNKDCRLWIDYEEDLNCCEIAIDKHGEMTLREIAKREGISYVRVKQIQGKALQKLKASLSNFGL